MRIAVERKERERLGGTGGHGGKTLAGRPDPLSLRLINSGDRDKGQRAVSCRVPLPSPARPIINYL